MVEYYVLKRRLLYQENVYFTRLTAVFLYRVTHGGVVLSGARWAVELTGPT